MSYFADDKSMVNQAVLGEPYDSELRCYFLSTYIRLTFVSNSRCSYVS